MGIPIQPTYEKCAILSNILNVSFGRAKDYAIITVTNKATGEIVHSKTYHNTSIVMIDMSSCEKGEYTIFQNSWIPSHQTKREGVAYYSAPAGIHSKWQH